MLRVFQYLFALPQYVLPHHPLSRLMQKLTHCRNRTWKNLFIRGFIRHFRVDMAEAEQPDPAQYTHFNDFFTRALNPAARPQAQGQNVILCPADGAISQLGEIRDGRIIQAKGRDYSVAELLGGDPALAERFSNGRFATIYLSPRDYHRLHMPLGGTLTQMIHVPGRLFSVNEATSSVIPRLFARNERVVSLFDTEAGPMALVLVGAIFVASIETVWHGVITPPTADRIKTWDYDGESAPRLTQGAEMGRFNMGSTIIVLFPGDRIRWVEELTAGSAVRVGQALGERLAG